MISRTSLTRLGKLIAQDIARGHVGDLLHGVGDTLAGDPKAMPTLLDLMAKESTRKKPDDLLIAAYGMMLGQGLEVLRYGVDRVYPEAAAAIAAIKAEVRTLVQAGRLEPAILLLVLQQFASARLPLDDGLQALLNEAMESAPPSAAAAADIGDFLIDLARHLDGDAFAIHGQLAEQAAVVPEPHRAAMAAALLEAPEPSLREAAIGWLLDGGATTRHSVVGLLEQAAGRRPVSGSMLRRMITLRNWLPESERPALDALVKACRLKGAECAPLAAAAVVAAVASGIDGSGAQSLFVLAKEGRKHAVASLLVKHGVGVRDAWVSHGMTRNQAEGMLNSIDIQIELFDISMDYLRETLGHALSLNARSGSLPPFGLIDVLETLGLATANPEPLPGEMALERLIGDIPGRMRGAASVKRALKASARWPEQYGFLQSWFEDGGDLDGLLDDEKLSGEQRLALVLEEYLPSRRADWADLLCRTALMLRAAPEEDRAWLDFVLVAREVAGERPLPEIPVMAMVALGTVEAWAARRG